MPPLPDTPLVVAIDGPAGSGKSTLARRLAAALGWAFLDTGAMYRALTLRALRSRIPLEDAAALAAAARAAQIDLAPSGAVRLDGEDVTAAIRAPDVDAAVSVVAAVGPLREVMRSHQRRFAAENGRIVVEGRDTGTAVFPDARVKVFLVASLDERIRRRVAELRQKDPAADAEAIRRSLVERDRADVGRAVDPLRAAPDALPVDTTGLGPDEVLARVLSLVRSRIPPSTAA